MEIVTGYKGQPHVTAENWADLNRGIIGSDSYVLSVGRKFESELVSNNLLKIRDGAALIQGRQFVIPSGQSDEITIENGTQGEKRTDLIVARYTKNNDTKVEEVMPVYIKGTPSASDPVLPDYNTDGDIRAGDLTADMPLYALDLEGINVVAVRPLFNVLESAAQLNSKLIDTGWVKVSENYNFYYRKVINTVWVWCYSTNEYEINGTNKNLFTLPEGCRPGRWIQTVGSLREVGQGANTQIEVSSSGVVSICTLGQTARKLWSALLCFPARDLI